MTSDYNGFSGDERDESTSIIEEAIKNGELKPYEETKCFICGQDKGIREYHCENYLPEKVVGNVIPLCKKCHSRVYGSKLDNPEEFRKYLEEVREIPKPPSYNKTYWLPSRDKILDSYNGFSPEIREFSKHIIKKAIGDGKLKPLNETKCSICGQDKGLRVYNIKDYSSSKAIIDSARPLCWTCNEYVERHEGKNPEVFERYVKEVQEKPRDPVYITNVWTKHYDSFSLSKSKYCKGIQCKKILWLTKYKPNTSVPKGNESVFKQGTEVGELAKGLFGDYVDVPFDITLTPMIEKTKELMKDKPIITEASFSYENNFCSVDILKNDSDGVEIYEVKSSKDIKEIYLDDASFQYYVLSNLGYNVKKVCLVLINGDYVKGKQPVNEELDKFFKIEDITSIAKEKQDEIRNKILEFNEFLEEHDENNESDIKISMDCFEPYDCDFWEYCTRGLPKPNVFDIAYMWKSEKIEKFNHGKITFKDLENEHFDRSEDKIKMQIEYELYHSEPYIDKKAIKEFLKLEYPLSFIDYEYCNPIIPVFEGTKSGQHVPFQYSLHILKEDGTLEHKEHLAEIDDENIIKDFACNMMEDIPKKGNIIIYNKSAEPAINRKIGSMYNLVEEMEKINKRMVDLMDPFRKRHYYTKEMQGSASLKVVLPALYPDNPELDYNNLSGVQKSMDAPEKFLSLKDKSKKEQKKIKEDLKKYCKLDTLAMVKIIEKLYEVTK